MWIKTNEPGVSRVVSVSQSTEYGRLDSLWTSNSHGTFCASHQSLLDPNTSWLPSYDPCSQVKPISKRVGSPDIMLSISFWSCEQHQPRSHSTDQSFFVFHLIVFNQQHKLLQPLFSPSSSVSGEGTAGAEHAAVVDHGWVSCKSPAAHLAETSVRWWPQCNVHN